MRRIPAAAFLAESAKALVLDVRSPGEYKHAHMPGAISLPLFSDEERATVGTAYKQQSREAAIKIGLEYFGPKMRSMVDEVERICDGRLQISDLTETQKPEIRYPKSEIFIYCWRGGMRSGAVAWLLNLYGFRVTVLAGGYKAYRQLVLQSFQLPYRFKILGGYTGSGKTEVLQQLKQFGEKIIDLEQLASHKGSAFGNINMPPQPSQEMFENLFSNELVNGQWSMVNNAEGQAFTAHHSPFTIWLEDESQRIGNINLPEGIWQNMRQSPIYFLDIPFEERLQHITEEYSQYDKEKLAMAIERIKKRLGGLQTKNALQFLADGNIKECFSILLQYYDKHYHKALHKRDDLSRLLTTVACATVSDKNALAIVQGRFVEI